MKTCADLQRQSHSVLEQGVNGGGNIPRQSAPHRRQMKARGRLVPFKASRWGFFKLGVTRRAASPVPARGTMAQGRRGFFGKPKEMKMGAPSLTWRITWG